MNIFPNTHLKQSKGGRGKGPDSSFWQNETGLIADLQPSSISWLLIRLPDSD